MTAQGQPLFEFSDPSVTGVQPPVLGLWTPRPAPVRPSEGVFFDTAERADPQAPVWRSNLPSDQRVARSLLDQSAGALRRSEQQLALLSRRFVLGQRAAQPDEQAVMFGTEDSIEQVAPGLGQLMDEAAQDRSIWQQAADHVQAVVDATTRSIAYYAWVETKLNEQVFARTAIGWLGDTRSFFIPGVGSEQSDLHRRSLGLAIKSRAILIRSLIAAVQLSSLVASGNVVLALPVAWRYINGAISDLREVRAL